MLVDRNTKRLDVPHEEGAWLELRRLSFAEVRELRSASEQAYFAALAGLPEEVLDAQLRVEAERAEARRKAAQEAKAAGVNEAPAADEPPADPLAGKDVGTILRFGVVAWSYTEADGSPVPVTGETIAMLDPETATWAAREIVLLGEAGGARLKGSSPSTAPSEA